MRYTQPEMRKYNLRNLKKINIAKLSTQFFKKRSQYYNNKLKICLISKCLCKTMLQGHVQSASIRVNRCCIKLIDAVHTTLYRLVDLPTAIKTVGVLSISAALPSCANLTCKVSCPTVGVCSLLHFYAFLWSHSVEVNVILVSSD